MLPFAPGITGYYTEKSDKLSLELRSLRHPQTATFTTRDKTIINTIKEGYSPILEDYLGDSLPGFSDVFFKIMEHQVPIDGEEREFEIFGGVKMKFCWIPAGEAQLGSTEEEQNYITKTFYEGFRPGWLEDERESNRGIHKTNGFWMAKYLVTQAQWEAVMGSRPSEFKGKNLPVETIDWYECKDFIKQCSVLGLKLQLPHEDQWEYACRGGRGNKQAFYWGNELDGSQANCHGDYPYGTNKKGTHLAMTTEVGSYEKVAPHPWNLCDMIGNVKEWCNDRAELVSRMCRGGCWNSSARFCRSSDRSWFDQAYQSNCMGFRLIIC